MMRRSTFRKSCEGGAASEAGLRSPAPAASPPAATWGSHLPQGRTQAAPAWTEMGGAAGILTDCRQEKKRAGRFSPKNTISEVEIDGQTDTGRDRDSEKAGGQRQGGRERTGRSRRWTAGLGRECGALGTD